MGIGKTSQLIRVEAREVEQKDTPKAKVIAKRGRKCQMCGYSVPKPNPLFLQRINYQKPETEANVILLCSGCSDRWRYPDNFEDAEEIKKFKAKFTAEVFSLR